ncbi:protein of unknown function [Burkholderia multivorans]
MAKGAENLGLVLPDAKPMTPKVLTNSSSGKKDH